MGHGPGKNPFKFAVDPVEGADPGTFWERVYLDILVNFSRNNVWILIRHVNCVDIYDFVQFGADPDNNLGLKVVCWIVWPWRRNVHVLSAILVDESDIIVLYLIIEWKLMLFGTLKLVLRPFLIIMIFTSFTIYRLCNLFDLALCF